MMYSPVWVAVALAVVAQLAVPGESCSCLPHASYQAQFDLANHVFDGFVSECLTWLAGPRRGFGSGGEGESISKVSL